MKITLLTNEYPPNIYGGAGVHVEHLVREFAKADAGRHEIDVLSFGNQDELSENLRVRGVESPFRPGAVDPRFDRVLEPLARNLRMAALAGGTDIVHCHTWYAHFGGILVKQLTGARLVLTTHSLEPHRPWKVEQLGRGYHASSWIERTAFGNADGVVAVSESMRRDVRDLYGVPDDRIRVIPNGIDLETYRPRRDDDVLRSYGIDPDVPYVLFVGRITRQKGIVHLVNAIPAFPDGAQVVLCAGQPDTPEIEREMTEAVERARSAGGRSIVWIPKMVPRDDIVVLYSSAALFVCPSVYEPFGIINLEAMACETPVVGSAVGGIPEIIVDGETGRLVPLEPRGNGDFEPRDPAAFVAALAAAVNDLLVDDALRVRMGRASRQRVEERFGWPAVAAATLAFYGDVRTTEPVP